MSEFVNTIDALGDDALTDRIIDRSITEYSDNTIVTIGDSAFYNCTALATANFQVATSIKDNAFNSCVALATADFPLVTSINTRAFQYCRNLTTLILRNAERIADLLSTSALENTPIKSGTGYIYVPSALVDSYKSASNWSNFGNQIRAIEDHPEITGG